MNVKVDRMIIAHRGESFIAPENTMAAINLAWEKGANAVEIDVHLSLDKKVVVIHDNTTKRTGNINKTIKKSTLEDLKLVDVGAFKDKKWKGEQIPTLSEVLTSVPSHGKLIIEIKGRLEIIEPLVTLIRDTSLALSKIEIISFNLKVLVKIRKFLPETKILWLLDLDYYLPAWLLFVNTKKIIRKVLKYKLNGVNVWAGNKINTNFIDQFREHNLLVYTWTVNNVKTANALLEMNVDAITTDRAAWLKEQL